MNLSELNVKMTAIDSSKFTEKIFAINFEWEFIDGQKFWKAWQFSSYKTKANQEATFRYTARINVGVMETNFCQAGHKDTDTNLNIFDSIIIL